MEIDGAKTVVFGVGGAGCRLIGRLAKSPPPDTELIALDTDKAQLDALGISVKKVAVGLAIDKCGSFEEMKKSISDDMPAIESSLEGAGIAIIVVGLGGKTGGCLADFLVEICAEKKILNVVVGVYTLRGANNELLLEDAIRKLGKRPDGVIIVDNSPREKDANMPITAIFERVNNLIVELISAVATSVSSAGSMNLRPDELRQFLGEGIPFVLTVGRGANLEEASSDAIKSVKEYGIKCINRNLAFVTAENEPNIEEVKSANDNIESLLSSEEVKWAQSQSPNWGVNMLLISGITDLPKVEDLAEEKTGETAVKEVGLEVQTKTEAVAPVEATVKATAQVEAPVESEEHAAPKQGFMASIFAQIKKRPVTPNGPSTESSEAKRVPDEKRDVPKTYSRLDDGPEPEAEEDSEPPKAVRPEVKQVPGSGQVAKKYFREPEHQVSTEELLEDVANADVLATETIVPIGRLETKRVASPEEEPLDEIPEVKEVEEIAPEDQEVVNEEILDDLLSVENEEVKYQLPNKTFAYPPPGKVKNQALIGMYNEPKKKVAMENPKLVGLKRYRTEPTPMEEEDSLDDVVGELSGFPNVKSKGQKRIGEYREDYGIGFV